MFKENIYISRRKILSNQINDGMILLPGNMPVPMNYPSNTLRFRQDSNFLYYCGLDYPNLTIVIDSTNGETTLFGDDLEVDDIVWEGERVTVKKMAESAGIDHVEKNSVEEIYSRHFLEHLTFAQAEACIKSWSAILKPDGKIQIIVLWRLHYLIL